MAAIAAQCVCVWLATGRGDVKNSFVSARTMQIAPTESAADPIW
jgi:hypothetical protein